MSEENVGVVRRVVEEFQSGIERSGDPLSVFDLDFLADDFDWVIGPGLFAQKEVYRGRAGLREFWHEFTENIEGTSIRLERLIDAGDDRVVAIAHLHGTGKGSGVPVDWPMGQVHELEGGHLIRVTNYATPADALEAAGLRE